MFSKPLSLVAMLVTLSLGAGCAVESVDPVVPPAPAPEPSVVRRSTMAMTVSDLSKLDAIARLLNDRTEYTITFEGSRSWTRADWDTVMGWLEPKANVRASFA